MKLSSSLIAAVSVNIAAAAVHTGPHLGAHHPRSVDSWEGGGMSLTYTSVYSAHNGNGGKHHNGNGGKHDSGVDGHHPGYNMWSVVKSSKAKSHKASTKASKSLIMYPEYSLSHPIDSLSHPIEKAKSSKSKAVKDHSIPVHVMGKATWESTGKTQKTPPPDEAWSMSTVAPVAPIEDPVDNPIPEVLPADNTAEGVDTSVMKVVGKDDAVNVILTGSKGSHQSKLEDEKSVNLKGQEQASILSDTRNSGSITVISGAIAGGVCLLASASYVFM
jgi:hypothetical protein